MSYVVILLDCGKATGEAHGPYATEAEAQRVGQTCRSDWMLGTITPEPPAIVNVWSLYSDHPGFAQAHDRLEAGWETAKNLSPDRSPADRARVAGQFMHVIMRSWRRAGAFDTEPRAELRRRIAEHFGVDWS